MCRRHWPDRWASISKGSRRPFSVGGGDGPGIGGGTGYARRSTLGLSCARHRRCSIHAPACRLRSPSLSWTPHNCPLLRATGGPRYHPYGPRSGYGTLPTGGATLRTPATSGGSMATPARPRPKTLVRVSSIAVPVVIVVAVILVLIYQGRLPWINLGLGSGSNPPTTATAFTDTFQNNDRNWTVGSLDNGNFTAASPSGGQYTLTVGTANNIS